MKLVTGLLAAVLLLAGIGASHAVVRIGEDRGGREPWRLEENADAKAKDRKSVV